MKKQHLTSAGIFSAAILVVMFIAILTTGTFSIFPTVSIDPVADHAAGDLVVITGTTNCPAGTRLTLDILTPDPAAGESGRIGGTDAFIVLGGGLTNTWSGALDTAGILPGEYRVNAYWNDERDGTKNVRSGLLASTRLILTNKTADGRLIPPLANHTLAFIHINRPGIITRGEKILVSGTTNVPENTELLYLVIQQTNTSVFTIDPKTREQDMKGGFTRSGLIAVLPGENGVGRWSFAFDSTEAIPGDYEILVTCSSVSIDKIGSEGPFGSEPLVIMDADADRLTPVAPDTGPCQSITIDMLPDHVTSRNITITGTTSLQPGTELLFDVTPAEFSVYVKPGEPGMTSGSMTGAIGEVEVIRGPGATNTWSLDLDLTTFPPEQYIINISNNRFDSATLTMRYGDRYCAGKFTLGEISP